MEWKFEEKETYTLEDVQAIVEGFKVEVGETIKAKDETITGLTTEVEKVEELTKSNHELSIQNLAISNGIDKDMIDLIYDEDLEKVQSKIDKLKELTKEKEIDNSFKPEKKGKSDDQYEKAIKDGDVEGAIKHKFNRLFQ